MDTAARPAAPMPLLVAMMISSQVAITIFLPSLPTMAADLGTSQAAVQMTVTAYLGAFALAQLVVGPLSDAFGRRGPLLVGLVLFTVASVACAPFSRSARNFVWAWATVWIPVSTPSSTEGTPNARAASRPFTAAVKSPESARRRSAPTWPPSSTGRNKPC